MQQILLAGQWFSNEQIHSCFGFRFRLFQYW